MPAFPFDLRTLVLVNMLLGGALTVLVFILARDRSLSGMRSWGFALVSLTVGFLIHGLRGAIPEVFAVVAGNGALLTALLFADRSARHINGQDLGDPLGWSVTALAMIGLGTLYFTVPDLRWRGLLFSLAAAFLIGRAASRFYFPPNRESTQERSLIAIVLVCSAAIHFFRAMYYLASPPWEDFFAATAINVSIFLSSILLIPATTLCIIWLELASLIRRQHLRSYSSQREPAPTHENLSPHKYSPDSTANRKPASNAMAHGKARVLIVDDNSDYRDSIEEVLTPLGYEVATASSADAAQGILRSSTAQPDVVLLDVVVPGILSGLGLARELEKNSPDAKVILLTGYASEIANAYREGFIVILKPFSTEVLIAAVEGALMKRTA